MKIKIPHVKIKTSRLLIYFFCLFAIIATLLTVHYVHQSSQKLISDQNLQQHLDDSAIALKKIKATKNDYQAQGVDTSAVEAKISQIYYDLYKNHDYLAADSLIKEVNGQLDSLLADFNANKLALETQKQIAEQKKGDLSGVITCGAAKCNLQVSVKLLSGKVTVASAQTNQTGNYSFHQDAGSYNLSASLSGYTTIYKSSINVIAQKTTLLNLDLKKNQPSNPTGGTTTPTGGTANISPATQEFNLINDYRVANGLAKLSLDSAISAVANSHSIWMNSTGTLSHTGVNGSTFWDRCAAAGTSCSGEIIYMGSTNPADAFNSWENSPPHNAIMLGSNFTTIGIGIAGTYWTADFR